MKKVIIAAKHNLARELGHGPRTYFEERQCFHLKVKEAVAKRVVERFLQAGDSLLLDAGSSSYLVAQEIARRSRTEPVSTHFSIMTHNYRAFETLVTDEPSEAHVNTFLTGGRYDRDLNALFGYQTVMAYENFYPRVVVIAVSGLVADIGLFCHGNTEELEVKKLVFSKPTRDRIILADHTKIGALDALCFGATQALLANAQRCTLITDEPSSDAPIAIRQAFAQELDKLRKVYGVNVEVVTL